MSETVTKSFAEAIAAVCFVDYIFPSFDVCAMGCGMGWVLRGDCPGSRALPACRTPRPHRILSMRSCEDHCFHRLYSQASVAVRMLGCCQQIDVQG